MKGIAWLKKCLAHASLLPLILCYAAAAMRQLTRPAPLSCFCSLLSLTPYAVELYTSYFVSINHRPHD
eukprot:scaffold54531_cov69-Phaeocystis_antarctica.AAC.1